MDDKYLASLLEWRVVHFPQVPCKPFEWPAVSFENAKQIVEILAYYDLFQFENKIKPDYCNSSLVEFRVKGSQDPDAWENFDVGYDEELIDWDA